MRALVVYESMFGNTQTIANAIAEGLRSDFAVDAIEVGRAPVVLDAEVDLVVVGGPTHAWSMSRARTRQGIDPKPISGGRGIREWLAALETWPSRTAAATFDTRFRKPRWMTGSAARSAQKRLGRKGIRTIVPAESFFVDDSKGPLIAGEQERALRWGRELAHAVRSRPASITA
jgi:hypothetical protein